jgi:hypothetical protein
MQPPAPPAPHNLTLTATNPCGTVQEYVPGDVKSLRIELALVARGLLANIYTMQHIDENFIA